MSRGSEGIVVLIFWILAAIVVFIIITFLVIAYISMIIGKFSNYAARVLFGWTLSPSSDQRYISFCTVSVLTIVPLLVWWILIYSGLGFQDGLQKVLVAIYATIWLIGYYSGHFGTSPDTFSALQAAGVMQIHQRETIWRNTMRNEGLIFWHWTIARRAVDIEDWVRRAIKHMSGTLTGD